MGQHSSLPLCYPYEAQRLWVNGQQCLIEVGVRGLRERGPPLPKPRASTAKQGTRINQRVEIETQNSSQQKPSSGFQIHIPSTHLNWEEKPGEIQLPSCSTNQSCKQVCMALIQSCLVHMLC